MATSKGKSKKKEVKKAAKKTNKKATKKSTQSFFDIAKNAFSPLAEDVMNEAKKYAKEKVAPTIKKAVEDSANEMMEKVIPAAKDAAKKASEETVRFAKEKAIPTAKKAAQKTADYTKNVAAPAVKKAAVKTKDKTVELSKKVVETTKTALTEEKINETLNMLYVQSVNGIPKVSLPIDDLVEDYLEKNKDVESAANSLVRNSVIKCGTSGFITNLGGFTSMIVGLPANLTSVMYVQLRMCAAVAAMGGYDVHSDQVQTMIYACLTGSAMADVIKQTGVKFGQKITTSMIQKIPGAALTKINQAVGFRFLTKFGETGLVNLVDFVPVLGGAVGGGLDIASTTAIGKNAISVFIKGEMPVPSKEETLNKIPVNAKVKVVDADTKQLEKAVKSKKKNDCK